MFLWTWIFLENPDIPHTTASTQKEQHSNEIVEDLVFFKPETDVIIAKGHESKADDHIKLNGDAIVNELNGESDADENMRSSNGAEAYENLVKSLTADDYMKELEEESIVDENFSIMESNIIDFTSQPELF